MEIDGIVFDKDGTLYDFNATWSGWMLRLLHEVSGGDPVLVETLAEVVSFDTDRCRFRKDSPVIAGTVDEVAALMAPFLDMGPAEMGEVLRASGAKVEQLPVCDLPALMGDLRRNGYAIGIATNDSEYPAREHLERSAVLDLFDFVAGADSGFGAKPGPGQLLAFCEQTGCAPDACVMIGDSSHDMIAARQAGMVCLGVLTGPAEYADLAPHCDDVIESIRDLPAWLEARKAG
ncbi:HAD family hydrolase [Pelagovum pacificum]|uniref:HAD family hydrolase n=1 Tax=Pelagovum pacificum TaxID=2588711 RepID=A0A5C5GGZ0_9RHOB|nr:HAD family hydrolase [Pelagovum pacificum]QQA43654.1 HAD family hydrolase [Pelagovum pacificum]TNY33211.1 HAD family hydrolase [Pelagovum pacificum]